MKPILVVLCALPLLAVLFAPGGAAATPAPFSIASPAFAAGGAIPSKHTCEGEDVSPELVWAGIPDGTKSLALIVDDPDAPDPAAPKMTWVQWVLFDLPPKGPGLAEGVRPADLPKGTLEGKNDWKRTGWGGPRPPIGTHRYFFKLNALDAVLSDLGSPTKAALEKSMEGHVLAKAELVGTYRKADGGDDPMRSSDATPVRLLPDVVSRVVAGEVLVVDLKSGHYLDLDPVGTRIWELISDGRTFPGLQEGHRPAPGNERGSPGSRWSREPCNLDP
jgi:hypothetical protein